MRVRTLALPWLGILGFVVLLLGCTRGAPGPQEVATSGQTPSAISTPTPLPTATPTPTPTPTPDPYAIPADALERVGDSALVKIGDTFLSYNDDVRPLASARVSGLLEVLVDKGKTLKPSERYAQVTTLARVEGRTKGGSEVTLYVPMSLIDEVGFPTQGLPKEEMKIRVYSDPPFTNIATFFQAELPTSMEIVLDREVQGTVAGHPDNPAGLQVYFPAGAELNVHGYVIRRGEGGEEPVLVVSLEWLGRETLGRMARNFRETGNVWYFVGLVRPEDLGLREEDLASLPNLDYGEWRKGTTDEYVKVNTDFILNYIVPLEELEFLYAQPIWEKYKRKRWPPKKILEMLSEKEWPLRKLDNYAGVFEGDKKFYSRWKVENEILHKPKSGAAIEIANRMDTSPLYTWNKPEGHKYEWEGWYYFVLNYGKEGKHQLLIQSIPPRSVDIYKYEDMKEICGWEDDKPPEIPLPEGFEGACRPLSMQEKWEIADTVGRYVKQREMANGLADFDRVLVMTYSPGEGWREDKIRDLSLYFYLQSLKTLFGEKMPYFQIAARSDLLNYLAFIHPRNASSELYDVLAYFIDSRKDVISLEKIQNFGWQKLEWNEEESRYEVPEFAEDEAVLLHIGDMYGGNISRRLGMEKGYFYMGNKKWPEMGQFLSELIDSLPPGSVVLWDNSFFRRNRGWTWDRAVKYVTKKWPDKHHALPFWVRYKPAYKVQGYLDHKLPKLDDPKAMGRLYAYAGLEATLPMLTGQSTQYPKEFAIAGAGLSFLWHFPGVCDSACVRETQKELNKDKIYIDLFHTSFSDDYLLNINSYFSPKYTSIDVQGLFLKFTPGSSENIPPKIPIHMAYPSP